LPENKQRLSAISGNPSQYRLEAEKRGLTFNLRATGPLPPEGVITNFMALRQAKALFPFCAARTLVWLQMRNVFCACFATDDSVPQIAARHLLYFQKCTVYLRFTVLYRSGE
jgi:hypothetical protein